MRTVAVICEYNPFHDGHKHHIDSIRREFGEDTAIIAIMSGSFTQRGEIAIADKGTRARAAVDCGVNLVLELPFPFCISSAEHFAKAGVSIIASLGVVDCISFGSECGNAELITKTARITLSEEYQSLLHDLCRSSNHADLGYPKLCELALSEIAKGEDIAPLTPNNILAIEYAKALISGGYNEISIHTVKREGAGYNDTDISTPGFKSASAIREALYRGEENALSFTPEKAREAYAAAVLEGGLPCLGERLSVAAISNLRIDPSSESLIGDADDGLYKRLKDASLKTNSIDGLVRLTETKKFTKARIRRVIWYSLLGVTSSELRETPHYTQVLAMDKVGQSRLKSIGKHGKITVLTKPTATAGMSEAALAQYERSMRAEAIFQLSRPVFADGSLAYKFTPYVKKGE